MTFVSTSRGFVLGLETCPTGSCATLATTADGGSSWAGVARLPAAVNGSVPGVSKVRFATSSDGWAFGPQLWATHDGGLSWRQITVAGAVSDVEASGGVAYALTASCANAPCSAGDRLLRTAAASDSWAAVPGLTLPDAFGSIALHAHAAWLVVGNAFVTSSDGTSWQTLADPCVAQGPDIGLAAVAPVSTSALYLLCAGDSGAGSEEKRVLFSTDAGAHAAATSGSPPNGGIASGIAAASTAVVAVPASSGASELYRSADGGHTWGAPLSKGDGGIGYFDVGFTSATQGVAIYGDPFDFPTSTSLLMTHDAGATWKPVTF